MRGLKVMPEKHIINFFYLNLDFNFIIPVAALGRFCRPDKLDSPMPGRPVRFWMLILGGIPLRLAILTLGAITLVVCVSDELLDVELKFKTSPTLPI